MGLLGWNDVEMEIAIVDFITGWAHCRKLPYTEISTKGILKEVRFGAPVYGRDLELFHYFQESPLPKELNDLDKPHWVTIFSHTDKVIKEMEDLGYVSRANEFLMRLSLIKREKQYKKYVVEKVTTKDQAKKINNTLGFEKFNPDRIGDPTISYHFIQVDHTPVCTGIISTKESSSCLDRIHTHENYRGMGLAATLCSSMLDRCLKNGVTSNVLGSSQMGFHLYRKLGYETVIPMYVFEKR